MADVNRCTVNLVASLTVLSGCAGQGAAVATAPAGVISPQADSRRAFSSSWMKPNTSGESLLYVSIPQGSNSKILVYSYQQGKLVGAITGPREPLDLCADADGDVFIPTTTYSGGSAIYEYAHGGTSPIATLSDPGEAYGCAVDPKTGNLAVANSSDASNPYYSNAGDVAIYAGAQGNPAMYYSSEINGFGDCGYDDVGNLYLSAGLAGKYYRNQVFLARLSSGSSSFTVIALNKKLYTNGSAFFSPSVQWDGKHMTVTSFSSAGSQGIRPTNLAKSPVLLYRLSITGSSGTVIGTTTLDSKKNHHGGQSWIQGKSVVGIYYDRGPNVGIWRYPRGGNPQRAIHKIEGFPDYPLWGLTVSVAESR